jgi:cation transport ATPase
MSSPFKTSQEFLSAKGPIYSFGGSPVIIGLFLVISVAISLWFIYASYTMKNDRLDGKNSAVLSILLALSAFSIADVVYKPQFEKTHRTVTQKEVAPERVSSSKQGQGWQVPAALLGMTVAGGTLQRRSRNKSRRSFQKLSSVLGSVFHQIRRVVPLRKHSPRTSLAYRSKRRSW